MRATGVKNSGNETREPPFRGSIVIAQNAEVSASDAILQRIVHLAFDKATHTPRTGQLAKQLERMPVEHVSGFVLRATQREAKVLAALTAAGHPPQWMAVPNEGHGFYNEANSIAFFNQLQAFLDAHIGDGAH